MAERYWPDEDPLGQRLIMGSQMNDRSPAEFELVGIVGNQRDTRLDAKLEPYMYVSYRQQALRFMCFTIRTATDPLNLIPAVRKEVAAVTRDDAPYEFASMNRLLRRSVSRRYVMTFLTGIFALTALALAAVGIYGVLSYLVAQRSREIGVRMALGAQRRDVIGMVLKQGLTLAAVGIVIGLAISLAGSRVLSSMLFHTGATDFMTFSTVSLLLAAVASLACYIPARRAAKVDPMVALRCE